MVPELFAAPVSMRCGAGVERRSGALWAGMFGFEQREYSESVEGSEAAPTVDFGS